VFEPNYALRPIHEMAAFIAQGKHLPGLPSAADIKRDGLNVTAFQMKLLEKIEELTLHAVQQAKTIRDQQARLEVLEKAMKRAGRP
jgi:hypothetical protein